MRCIAHVALHFNTLPSQLDTEQIEYLLMVKKRNTTPSESFFKHTVYGLRFLFRYEGRNARAIQPIGKFYIPIATIFQVNKNESW